ncbi:MAG: hypothetical protein ACTMIR_16300 [Cellulomonadaceae bacterium]
MTRRVGTMAAATVVVGLLVGCSGGAGDDVASTAQQTTGATQEDPAPTSDDVSPSAEATEGDGEEDRPWCQGLSANEGTELETTFGEMGAASDEWSAAQGRQWRHFFPATVRNVSDAPCLFQVMLVADMEGGEYMYEQVNMALKPGQAYHFQAFDLDEVVEFTADAPDAQPAVALSPRFDLALQRPLVPVYEADLDVEGVQGEGADAVLVADITVTSESWQWEARPLSAPQDKLYLNGLDADGDVIARAYAVIDPPKVGETTRVEIPVAGGSSSGAESGDGDSVRNQVPVSTYADVVSWEIGALQPDTNYWLTNN